MILHSSNINDINAHKIHLIVNCNVTNLNYIHIPNTFIENLILKLFLKKIPFLIKFNVVAPCGTFLEP